MNEKMTKALARLEEARLELAALQLFEQADELAIFMRNLEKTTQTLDTGRT